MPAHPSPRFPGPQSAAMIKELSRYVLADPYPFCVDLEKSEGMWLVTVEGERLFDWAGYYGSKWIAHNHPRLFEPAYLRKLGFAANNKLANPDFLTRECLDYYRVLREVAPRCMLSERLEIYTVNSGAEAVENMMKYFINLHDRKPDRKPGPRRFIYFDQAFHGRTIFALNVTELTHAPVITRDYHGLVHGNIQVPFPAVDEDASADDNRRRTAQALALVEKLLREHAGEIVAIVLEPLQGAGGHRAAEKEFFQGLSRLAHDHDVFLGLDEVQTAGGQTGSFFMVDQLDLPYPPQAIATGKKLGNGVIYMLHPMEDEGVPVKAQHLLTRLRELRAKFPAHMRNIRGAGLYQGFSLATPALKSALLSQALEAESLLLLGAGDTSIRLRPNLHVTTADIDRLAQMLYRLLSRLAS